MHLLPLWGVHPPLPVDNHRQMRVLTRVLTLSFYIPTTLIPLDFTLSGRGRDTRRLGIVATVVLSTSR